MRNRGRHCLLVALAAFAIGFVASRAAADTRVALIIANSRYAPPNALKNPSADARLIETALKKAGFIDVTVAENLGRDAMGAALADFEKKADHADVALVYYAGHGIEVNHVNYLVPVDDVFSHMQDIEKDAVNFDRVLAATAHARRLRLIILDACRGNPFAEDAKGTTTGVISRGLEAIDPQRDLLVVFSAKGSTKALDGVEHSPFADALARRIVEPGLEINKLFRQVGDDVLYKTGDYQQPVTYGTSENYYFIPPTDTVRSTAGSVEFEAWTLCKESPSRLPCDDYARRYGSSGEYAPLVATRLAVLEHGPAAPVAEGARSTALPGAAPAARVSPPSAVASALSAISARVGDLGFSVHYDAAGKGLLVDSVDRNARVAGQLFTGDLITKIDAALPDATQSPDAQLAAIWKSEARLKLLVQRGGAPSSVVIK